MTPAIIPTLTFTRFLAAIWVVVFHFIAFQNFDFFRIYPLKEILKNGNLAVLYFFVLSGFIMTVVYSASQFVSPKIFYLKRFARIYPMYLLALLASSLFTGSSSVAVFITNLLCLEVFDWNLNIINSPGWSIGEEFIFYALFPFAIPLIKRINLKMAFMLLLLLFASSTMLHSSSLNYPFQKLPFFLWFFQPFLFGILTAVIYKNEQFTNFSKRNGIWAPFILLLLCMSGGYLISYLSADLYNGLPLFSIISSGIILSLSTLRKSSFIYQLFTHRFCIHLGEISYTIYIIQYPVFKAYSYFLSINSWKTSMLFLVILLVISAVLHRYFEKPVRKFIVNKSFT